MSGLSELCEAAGGLEEGEIDVETCIICYEVPVGGYYCGCCSKRMCQVCATKYSSELVSGKGCPCCRSTLGIVHVLVSFNYLETIILRMDGNEVTLPVSSRALRNFERGFKRLWDEEIASGRERSELGDREYMTSVALCVKSTIQAFLENSEVAQRMVGRGFGDGKLCSLYVVNFIPMNDVM